jgi:hypothetical protein
MNSWSSLRVACLVLGVIAIANSSACSDDETIVSVNVNSADEVGNPSSLVITISQAGQTSITKDIMPPTRTQDSGVSIQPMFFERVQLPDAWDRAMAEVRVDARDGRGVYLSAMTAVQIRPGGAVAAFVNLGKKPEMMPPAEDDAGAAGSSGGM